MFIQSGLSRLISPSQLIQLQQNPWQYDDHHKLLMKHHAMDPPT